MCTYLKSAEVWVFPLNYLLLLLLSLRSKHHWMVERPHCTLISTCCVYIYVCMYTRGHRACSVHTPNSVPAPKPHDGTMFTRASGLAFRCCFKDPRVVHTVLFLSPTTSFHPKSMNKSYRRHSSSEEEKQCKSPTWWILLITHTACFDCAHTPQTVNCVNMC